MRLSKPADDPNEPVSEQGDVDGERLQELQEENEVLRQRVGALETAVEGQREQVERLELAAVELLEAVEIVSGSVDQNKLAAASEGWSDGEEVSPFEWPGELYQLRAEKYE